MKRIPTPDDGPKNLITRYPGVLQPAENPTHGSQPDFNPGAGQTPQFMTPPDVFSGAASRPPVP